MKAPLSPDGSLSLYFEKNLSENSIAETPGKVYTYSNISLLIYNYIANRQRLRCVLQINERRYINMRIKVYGKSHLEGIAKKTGNPYNFNQVHYLGKARNVEGQAALTLALDPRDYPIDRIEVGKEYDVEFDQRGYVIGFTLAR